MTRKDEEAPSRRDFLKAAATAAPLATMAVATATGADAAPAAPDPESNRIQDTAHVRAYYDSARF